MNAREGVEALVDAACPDRQARRTIDLFEDSVREQATVAAYRAAADEIQAEADDLNIPGSPASSDVIRGMVHAVDHLRARADQMEQP